MRSKTNSIKTANKIESNFRQPGLKSDVAAGTANLNVTESPLRSLNI
jgi:hypothetical protein